MKRNTYTQIIGSPDNYPAFIGIRMSDEVMGLAELTVLDSRSGHHTVLRAGHAHNLNDTLNILKEILCVVPKEENDE